MTYRNYDERKRIVDECRNSELNVSDWCKANDIPRKTYYRYKDEIEREERARGIFIKKKPVSCKKTDKLPVKREDNGDIIRLIGPNIIIELPKRISPAIISMVIKKMTN